VILEADDLVYGRRQAAGESLTSAAVEGTDVTADTFETAADSEDARFTAWLRARADPDWSAAVDHRFVAELGAGTPVR
jgi:hypothetical protein